MKSVTSLPAYAAGWFTHLHVTWQRPISTNAVFSYAMAAGLMSDSGTVFHMFAGLLVNPERGIVELSLRNDAPAPARSGEESEWSGRTSNYLEVALDVDSDAQAALGTTGFDEVRGSMEDDARPA